MSALHQEPMDDPNVATVVLVNYTPPTAEVGKNADPKIDKAFEVYEHQVQVNIATEKLKKAKEELMDLVPEGWKQTINERGGEVMITKSGKQRVDGDKMVANFDMAAFNRLPAKTRADLIKKGVITIEPKVIKASAATVRVTVR